MDQLIPQNWIWLCDPTHCDHALRTFGGLYDRDGAGYSVLSAQSGGGAYVPTYTLCVGISGLFYGLVLYRKPVTLRRVFLAKLLVILVSNILLNSIALAPTVGSGFIGILPARILKNLLLLPIQTIVVYMILKFVKELKPVKAFEAR